MTTPNCSAPICACWKYASKSEDENWASLRSWEFSREPLVLFGGVVGEITAKCSVCLSTAGTYKGCFGGLSCLVGLGLYGSIGSLFRGEAGEVDVGGDVCPLGLKKDI